MVATPAQSVLEDFVQFGQVRVVGPLRSAIEDVRDCENHGRIRIPHVPFCALQVRGRTLFR
jgi:hypothetical protein